jgi:RNA polymerase sigma-70 factor, ECF subfamily
MDPRREIDQVTLRRAQRGDANAWRSLVAMYQSRVYGICRRIIGSRDAALAQDAAQETFIDVFTNIANFSSAGSARLSSWILTIASHRAIDIVRRRGVERRLISDAAAAEQTNAASLHVNSTIDLDAALQHLSAEHRAVFVLCDVYEFSYAEVSAALKLELGTVRSRLARARASARKVMTSANADQERRPA